MQIATTVALLFLFYFPVWVSIVFIFTQTWTNWACPSRVCHRLRWEKYLCLALLPFATCSPIFYWSHAQCFIPLHHAVRLFVNSFLATYYLIFKSDIPATAEDSAGACGAYLLLLLKAQSWEVLKSMGNGRDLVRLRRLFSVSGIRPQYLCPVPMILPRKNLSWYY